MEELSLWKMLEIIGNLILSSPFFLMTLIIGLIMVILMIISIRKYKKITRGLMIGVWLFLVLFIVIRYNDYLYVLFDNLINNIFMQIFFPSLVTYVIILLISTGILLYSLFSQNLKKIMKIINFIFTFIIWFLTLLTLDIIVNSGVNIYEPLTIYSDKTLLVLVEMSMIVFVLWMLLLLSIKLILILIKKSDEKIVKDFLKTDDKVEVLKL